MEPANTPSATGRLPGWVGPVYGLGSLAYPLFMYSFAMWITYFYAPPPGQGISYVPLAFVGAAVLVGRVIDALGDVVMGAWSDATRTRWGRRIPFMVISSLPILLTFGLLWMPPVEETSLINLAYLIVISIAFFVALSAAVAPYLALLPELASDGKERLQLGLWQAIFSIVGLAAATLASSWLVNDYGFAAMGWVLGTAGALCYLVPALLLKEPPARPGPAPLPFRETIRIAMKHPAFRIYAVTRLCFDLGFALVLMGIPYLASVILGLSAKNTGVLMAASLAVAMLSTPLLRRIARQTGPKKALLFAMCVFVVLLFSWGLIGAIPGAELFQGILTVGLAGLPMAAFVFLPHVLVAEIADDDTRETGHQRAGVFYGIQGLVSKGAVGVAAPIFGLVLTTCGYSADDPTGIALVGPVAGLFCLGGVIAFSRYPLGGAQEPPAAPASPDNL